MSKSTSFLIFFFYLFILIVWGWVIFSIMAIFGISLYIFYIYCKKAGLGPWKPTASASLGGQIDPTISESKPKITFTDVAGIDEAKEELLEIVDFLTNPKVYLAVGAHLPRGILMAGPPGVGKTLCAKAIAGEANVPMIEMAGSSFIERYVGVGASNVRTLFWRAKKIAPCIIFIDEFDSLGRRGSGETGAEHEYDQTINQLLIEMDDFSTNEGVIVLAATNRMDKIDEALLRPGRFDVKIYFNRPDVKGREEILRVHAKGKKLSENVNLKDIAKATPGLTGADLADIMNKAAITVGKFRRKEIDQNDILAAKDRFLLGKEKKSMIIDPEEKKIIATHEAGHALLAVLLQYCDPPDKVSIIPRDGTLGITALSPGKERYNISKEFLCDQMVMLFGGRAAEKIVHNTETAGAKDDIEKATNIAMAMVCEYGMSEELGPIAVNANRGGAWGGGNMVLHMKAQDEVMKLVKESYARADDILTRNTHTLKAISTLLLDKETISGEEIMQLIKKP